MNPSTSDVQSGLVHDRLDPWDAMRPVWISNRLVQLVLGILLIGALYCAWIRHELPDFSAWTATIPLLFALVMAIFMTPRTFAPGYLLTLLFSVVSWRVAAMSGVFLMELIAPFAFAVLLAQGIEFAVRDWRASRATGNGSSAALMWQFTAIRIYFGLNEIGHATEKILAGKASFHTLVATFHGFGIGQYAVLFVIVGGLTELVSAISVGLGLFARLGALVSIVYFLVATIGFGHEWTRGYAWASAGGGGWEYVMLVLIVFLAVLIGGAGKFSLDAWLRSNGFLPKRLIWLSNGSGVGSH